MIEELEPDLRLGKDNGFFTLAPDINEAGEAEWPGIAVDYTAKPEKRRPFRPKRSWQPQTAVNCIGTLQGMFTKYL